MENHIFFIKYTPQLPVEFFHMAKTFGEFGIKLVPVRPQDISGVMGKRKVFAISMDNSIATHRLSMDYKKRFFDYALLNRRLVLFDISSFGKALTAYRAERAKCYFHFPLPDTINHVVGKITAAYLRDKRDVHIWPGGRRAKLPSG